VLLGEGEQMEAIVSQAVYRFFTDVETFKGYVRREVLASEAVEV